MKNTLTILAIAMGALNGGVAGAAPGDIEIPLTADKPNNRNAAILQSSSSILKLQAAVPAGQWKLPDFGGRKPAFTTLQIGGKTRLLAFDSVTVTDSLTDSLVEAFGEKSGPGAKFYNQLYFDANGNGDLTDDPAIRGAVHEYGDSEYFATTFPLVTATNTAGESLVPYSFGLRIGGRDNKHPAAVQCQLSPGLIYSGNASIDGVSTYFNLIDANINGSFNDPGVDKLFLSDNKQVPEMYPLTYADILVIGANSYQVKLDTAASKLILTPATGLTGKLLVPDSTDCLTLRGPGIHIALLHPIREVSVPAGTYTVTSYRLSRKDSKERTWFVESKGGMSGPATETTPTNSGVLLYGEPFEVVLNCKLQGKGAKAAVSMGFNTIGKGKESVAIPTRSNAPSQPRTAGLPQNLRPVPPSYQIFDSRGALITKGCFQLG